MRMAEPDYWPLWQEYQDRLREHKEAMDELFQAASSKWHYDSVMLTIERTREAREAFERAFKATQR
jgi:hypothetical protein